MSFSQRFRDTRIARGFTQNQLAALARVTSGTVQNYESGRSNPISEPLVALADVLGVSLDELAGRKELPPAPPKVESLDPVYVKLKQLPSARRKEVEDFIDFLSAR